MMAGLGETDSPCMTKEEWLSVWYVGHFFGEKRNLCDVWMLGPDLGPTEGGQTCFTPYTLLTEPEPSYFMHKCHRSLDFREPGV